MPEKTKGIFKFLRSSKKKTEKKSCQVTEKDAVEGKNDSELEFCCCCGSPFSRCEFCGEALPANCASWMKPCERFFLVPIHPALYEHINYPCSPVSESRMRKNSCKSHQNLSRTRSVKKPQRKFYKLTLVEGRKI